jgi:hypothetical protein
MLDFEILGNMLKEYGLNIVSKEKDEEIIYCLSQEIKCFGSLESLYEFILWEFDLK